MKKLLLSLSLVVGSIFGALADTATISYPAIFSHVESGQNESVDGKTHEVTASPIKISYAKAGGTSAPAYYENGTALRMYKKNTITFSLPENCSFNTIKLTSTGTGANVPVKGTTTDASEEKKPVGSFSQNGAISMWTTTAGESVNEVVLTIDPAANCRIQTIDFDYTVPDAAVATPEISYTLNGATATVSISCETEGADIFYSFSADEISTAYTGSFNITETCTVFAIAKSGDEESKIASKAITIPYTSFSDVYKAISDGTLKDDEELSIIGDFSVIQSFQYDEKTYNVILTDGSRNIFIYNVEGNPEVGANINKIEGTAKKYQNLLQIQNATLHEGGNGADYTAKQVNTLVNITDDNILDQIIINGCVVAGTSDNQTVSIGSETPIALYDRYGLNIENGVYKISAFVWKNNKGYALVPYAIEASATLKTVQKPVIKPDKRELEKEETISISCSTQDAQIYYTLDGTIPTQEATRYTGPFDPFVTENDETIQDVTIKVRAFYEGTGDEMNPSEIVTKEYHQINPYINVLDNSHEGATIGTSYIAHTCTVDGVSYDVLVVHTADKGIQVNKSKKSYIVQASNNEGLALDQIIIDFKDNGNGTQFTVKGSQVAYTPETYENGDYLGIIKTTTSDETVSFKFEKDYDYFSLYPSTSGVSYINSITIIYRDPAEADESEIPSFDEFEIISSQEEGWLMAAGLPTHENWTTKYKVNDGEETAYDPEEGITLTNISAATLHTFTVWHEHYYHHDAKTEPKEFHHLTQPNFTIDTKNETMSFGELGEGVKVYFTIDGSAPVIESETPANAPRRAKVSEEDNTYVIDDKNADLNATHVISKSNTTITVHNSVTQSVNINAKAVHAATGTISDAVETSGVTTSIEAIVADGAAKTVYDLMGRKVAKPAHGLYIINGQKVRL